MKVLSVLLLPTLLALASGKRLICYFTSWAGYREGDGKFEPAQVDPTRCTNILYAFASLDPNTLTIKPGDSWADLDKGYYSQIVQKAKSAGVKPSLSIGGWTDSVSDKYTRLLTNPSARANFVTTTVQYLAKYQFEGLDFDYEYPTCPQGNCNAGSLAEKAGLVELFKALRKEFTPRGWVLSAAISSDKNVLDRGYDIPAMNTYLDWIGFMTYDYHSSSESNLGPVSPLRTYNGDPNPTLNTEATVRYALSKGASREKVVIGAPLYGYNYRLASSSQNGYGAPSVGRGNPGPFTKDPGTLAFYEVCQNIYQKGWKAVENAAQGAYAYSSSEWVSYNSVQDVRNKAQFVNQENLGGILVWDISFDDFTGKYCNAGKNPLLTNIKNTMQ